MAENIGGAVEILDDSTDRISLRTLQAGDNVAITQNGDRIIIDATQPSIDGTTLGDTDLGAAIFKSKVNNTLTFRSIIAGDGVTLSQTDDNVIISTNSVVKGGRNLGTGDEGIPLLHDLNSNFLRFKRLQAGSGVELTDNGCSVIISAGTAGSAHGEVNVANNMGSGVGLFAGKNGPVLMFKSIAGTGGIRVLDGEDHIVIDGSASIGESNFGQNIGTGYGLYSGKNGTTLTFRGLVPGMGMSITQNETDLVLSSTGEPNQASNLGRGVGTYYRKINGTLQFKSIQAGKNVSVIDTVDSITISADAIGEVNTASNIGDGIGIFAQKIDSDIKLKTIVGDGSTKVLEGYDHVVISSPVLIGGENILVDTKDGITTITSTASGTIHDGQNIGNGYGLYTGLADHSMQFKSVSAGSNITISDDGTNLVISGTAEFDRTIGIPTSGSYEVPSDNDTVLPAVRGWTPETKIADAVDQLNKLMGHIIPDFASTRCLLAFSGGMGLVPNGASDNCNSHISPGQPLFRVVSAQPIEIDIAAVFGTSSGTFIALVNGSPVGHIILNSSSRVGVYNAIEVTSDEIRPYTTTDGFYRTMSATVRIAAPYGINSFQIVHSETGLTNKVYFYYGPDVPELTVDGGIFNEVERTFTVTLEYPSPTPVTVNYCAVDGEGLAGTDYTSLTGTLSFAPGETLKTIVVPATSNKQFNIMLFNADNAIVPVSANNETGCDMTIRFYNLKKKGLIQVSTSDGSTKPNWNDAPSDGFLGAFDEQSEIEPISLTANTQLNDVLNYYIVNGDVPTGMGLSKDGVFSGTTPMVYRDTTYTFTVRAVNSLNYYTDNTFTITINNTINESPVWNLTGGNVFSLSEQTTVDFSLAGVDYNDDLPLQFAILSGSLPSGLSISGTGRITGTTESVRELKTYSITAIAADTLGAVSEPQVFTFNILNTINHNPTWDDIVTTFTLPEQSDILIELPVSDIDGDDLTLVIDKGGKLPTGLRVEGTSIIGKTALVTEPLDYHVTMFVDDGQGGTSDKKNFTFIVTNNINELPVFITKPNLGEYNDYDPVSIQFSARDTNNDPLTYRAVTALPTGLHLTSTGLLEGMLNTYGDQTFTVEVFDGIDAVQAEFTMKVAPPAPIWDETSITVSELSIVNYTIPVHDITGDNVVSLEMIAGSLPPGLSFTNGKITGTAEKAIHDKFYTDMAFRATDKFGKTSEAIFSITIKNIFYYGPAWGTTTIDGPNSIDEVPSNTFVYNEVVAILPIHLHAAHNNPFIFKITNGSLPTGLELSPDGLITGTTPIAGVDTDYTVTIAVTDIVENISDTRDFHFTIKNVYNYAPVWSVPANLGSYAGHISYMSRKLTATDVNKNAITYSVVSSNLPPGVTFDLANTMLIGTPQNVPGTYSITLSASDGANTTEETFTFTVTNNLPVVIMSPIYLNEQATINYALPGYDLNSDTLTYRFVSGNLPSGVRVDPDGYLRGTTVAVHTDETPPSAEIYQSVIEVSDGHDVVQKNMTIYVNNNINDGPIWNTAVTSWTFNETTQISLNVSAVDKYNASEPVTYTVVSIPDWLIFHSDGSITGTTPSVYKQTTYQFTISAMSRGNTVEVTTQSFTIKVMNSVNDAPVWGQQRVYYTFDQYPNRFQLNVNDPNGDPLTVETVFGSLPDGLSMNTTGMISGTQTPQPEGTFDLRIRATDTFGLSSTADITIKTRNNPTWSWATPTNLGIYKGLTTASIPVSVKSLTPVTYAVIGTGCPLTLNGNVLTGQIPDLKTSYTFTIRATDAIGRTLDRTFTLNTVTAIDPALYTMPPNWITDSNLGEASITEASLFGLEATDPLGAAVTFSYASGTLPPGLSFTGNIVSGTASYTPGTYTFTITATASNGISADRTFTITVADEPPQWVTPLDLGVFNTGKSFAPIQLVATSKSGIASYTAGKSLINGFGLANNGSLYGTPLVGSGEYTMKVTATDVNGKTSVRAFHLTVMNVMPVWDVTGGITFTVSEGVAWNKQLKATTTNGATLSYSVTSGVLPTGISLSVDGRLSGTPGTVVSDTTFTFIVTVSDGYDGIATQQFTILVTNTVNEAPIWTTTSGLLSTIPWGTAASITLSATDPNGDALTYSVVSGSLPSGLTLSGNTITGTPTRVYTTTTSSFTIRAKDTKNASSDRPFSIKVSIPSDATKMPVWVTKSGQTWTVNEGDTVSIQLQVTDPNANITQYAVTSGSLPYGLMINQYSGLISGVAPILGQDTTYAFTVSVYDGDGYEISNNMSIKVHHPIVTVTWDTPSGTIVDTGIGCDYTTSIQATVTKV